MVAVVARVHDMYVEMRHHNKAIDSIGGATHVRVSTEAEITLTLRISDPKMLERMRELYGSVLEVELREPQITPEPRTEFDLSLGRVCVPIDSDVPESSKGESW